MGLIQRVKNYWFPTPQTLLTGPDPNTGVNTASGQDMSKKAVTRNLSNIIAPVQLARLRTDVKDWRDAATEAELAYYPHRVKMQRIYIDTVLNGHVAGCMERRKDLTMLRKYEFINSNEEVYEDLTKFFTKLQWFKDFTSYSLDALFYGYSLISLGDIVNENFKDVSIVRRWNISPDRYQVTSYIYSLAGMDWRVEPYRDWHIYVPTPSETGISPCGYGLLYKVALYEIFLRNLLGYNGDFVELYSQPYRVGKTTKTTETERGEFEEALRNMGSSAYALIDRMDEIEFLESNLGGTGWQGYDNFEQRCMKTISKLILGHADAMDSTPGKLGSGQDGKDSPVAVALRDKQVKDGEFMEAIINNELIPRMRSLGFNLPDDLTFRYKNDAEKEAFREKEDASNKVTAEIAQTMKNAGLQMSPEYFQERTGIPTEKIETPDVEKTDDQDPEDDKDLAERTKKIKNKLDIIYSR